MKPETDDRHVHESDLANNTPLSREEEDHMEAVGLPSLLPTRKWWAATITAATGVTIAAFTGDGINTDEEKILVITFVLQRLLAYVTNNDSTPGGVPEKD